MTHSFPSQTTQSLQFVPRSFPSCAQNSRGLCVPALGHPELQGLMAFSLTCSLCFVLKEQLACETQPLLAVLEREAIKASFFLFYSR